MKAQPNNRRIDLNLPIVVSATLTRRRFLAGAGVILTGPSFLVPGGTSLADETRVQLANTTRVRFRLVDAQTEQTTPAMACITDANSGDVRLPPDGRVATRPSTVQDFVSGVKFNPDPDWIGPVRKMQGQGNNNDRSYVYENRPSIPYWTEPVIYQTSGHFAIDLPAGRWRIRASHGMEYVPVAEEFELTGRGEVEKTLRLQRWIDLPALGFRLTAAAGSDTPWGSTIGEVRTYVHTGATFGVDTWFRNLKAGHTFVSNGPALEFTVDDALPGTELTRSPGARVKIRARARGHARVGLPTVLRVEGPAGVLKEVKSKQGESELAIELEHVTEASQWLMAGVVCDNDALAHTTPVYVVVNAGRTWNARLGPGIIDKQLAGIARIESELANRDDARTAGLRERLQHARAFYADLRERMSR